MAKSEQDKLSTRQQQLREQEERSQDVGAVRTDRANRGEAGDLQVPGPGQFPVVDGEPVAPSQVTVRRTQSDKAAEQAEKQSDSK